MTHNINPLRRQLLRTGAGSAAALLLGSATAQASALYDYSHEKIIRLHNTHTRENISVVFKTGEQYHRENLLKLNNFLRDHRQNESIAMDPKLFDQLWTIQRLTGNTDTFEVVSAYRTRTTNDMLRESSNGVAKNSFHTLGQAMDIRLRGCDCTNLKNVAISLEAGGVGFYPASKFVHIDTGPVRNWT